jgi:signal transduction histidine kinase
MATWRCGSPTSRSARRRSAAGRGRPRKDEFLATLAHELRNPLAPIRQAASIARSPDATDAQRRWSNNVIERQVQHMSLLLDDLLDVSRITHGTLQLRRQQTDLQSIVGAAVETARPLIDERQHRLDVDVPADLHVYGDPLRLAQVLSNLLTNAAKYTNPRGDIRIMATEVDAELVISVEDSGIGITSEDLPKVFGMFAQVRSAQEHAAGGLGIGLALAKGIVDLHGGRIEAASGGIGKGSRFTVRLPGASRSRVTRRRRVPRSTATPPTSASCWRTTIGTPPRAWPSSCGSKDTRSSGARRCRGAGVVRTEASRRGLARHRHAQDQRL